MNEKKDIKKNNEEENQSSIKIFFKAIRPYAILLIAALLIIYVLNTVVPTAFVSGKSMYPTLKNGDIVTCTKDLSSLNRGDIVVYKLEDGKRVIKRIIALPGDRIKIVDGQPFVNGEPSPYQYDVIKDAGTLLKNEHELTLENNQYFCLGDNRNESADCRVYGPIYDYQIVFKAKNVYSLFNID